MTKGPLLIQMSARCEEFLHDAALPTQTNWSLMFSKQLEFDVLQLEFDVLVCCAKVGWILSSED